MDGTYMDAVSMQVYIESMDKKTLPRILQVCSGVYFQGSVYEVSGSEVCLSTGDLLKVIGVELQSASSEDIDTKDVTELPLDYKGLFKMVLESTAYTSVEEIVSVAPVDLTIGGTFSFTSQHRLVLDGVVLEAGAVFTLLSVESGSKKVSKPGIHCRMHGQQGGWSEVFLPLTCHGEFYEYDNDHVYSLHQILASSRIFTRHFRHAQGTNLGGPFRLSPVYMVKAIMNLRRDVVTFPSSLEVDVLDVTEQELDISFIMPLTLEEVASKALETFPAMAQVIEGPSGAPPFKASWLKSTQKGQQLVIHGCQESSMVLASTLQGKKVQQHFLISHRYGGRIRRRPREFTSVFELCSEAQRMPGLTVSVSRHCEALEDGLDSLSVGDQLEVLRSGTAEVRDADGKPRLVEVLVCRLLPEEDEDEEDEDDKDSEIKSREIRLPMYLQGHFVEKVKDKKKYSLADLIKCFPLPLDVRVASRDTGLRCDPLADISALQLKETVVQPVVVTSLVEQPDECFELPWRWLSLTLCLTKDPLPWPKGQPPKMRCETVTELSEAFYFELHKMVDKAYVPPPLPPKRTDDVDKKSPLMPPKPPPTPTRCRSGSLPHKMNDLNLNDENLLKRQPPPPVDISKKGLPPLIPKKPDGLNSSVSYNTYVQTPKIQKASSDSDDDYESVEEFIQNAQRAVMF